MKSLMFATLLAAIVAQPASAGQFTIEGEADGLTLEAQGSTRSEVVKALAERFGFEIIGGQVLDGPVDGSFRGSLGQVLKSILPANGYALAFKNGKPSRITFTGVGGTEVATSTAVPTLPPPQMPAQVAAGLKQAETGQPTQPVGASDLQNEAPALMATDSLQPDRGDAESDMKNIKEMTDRVVARLEEVARTIKLMEPR